MPLAPDLSGAQGSGKTAPKPGPTGWNLKDAVEVAGASVGGAANFRTSNRCARCRGVGRLQCPSCRGAGKHNNAPAREPEETFAQDGKN